MKDFKSFLLSSPQVEAVIKPLSEQAVIVIQTETESLVFKKTSGGKPSLSQGEEKSDFVFESTTSILNGLFEQEDLSIAEYGIKIAEAIVRHDVKVKVSIGPWDFMKKGYASILTLGGKDFLKYLSTKNLSISSIGSILKKWRTR